MNVGVVIFLALLRAAFAAGLAVAAGVWLHRWLSTQSRVVQIVAWGLMLVPFFVPTWLSGNHYEGVVEASRNHGLWGFLLLSFKLLTAAVVMRQSVLPPALSPEAWHVYRLHGPGSRQERALFWVRAEGRGLSLMLGILFLLALAGEIAAWMENFRPQ